MSRFSLDKILNNASEEFRRKNPQLFGEAVHETTKEKVVQRMPSPKNESMKGVSNFARRLDGINKTERRYYDTFLADRDGVDCTVLVQPPRLFELDGGGTYTPDFFVINEKGCVSVEIKGGYKGPGAEQGIERWKRAAAQWADERLAFVLSTWHRKERRWVAETWNTSKHTKEQE